LNISGIKFNVILENTELLGDYMEGASERGLSIITPSDISSLKIFKSDLGKIAIASENENISVSNLALGDNTDFNYKNIELRDVSINSQWGFLMRGGTGSFTNSLGLKLIVYEDADLSISDSEINEFVPVNFTGTVNFERVTWKDSGLIIGNNNFIWRGAWTPQGFDSDDFRPLVWIDSRVTREFPIDILSVEPIAGFVLAAKIELFDKNDNLLEETYTDKGGRAYFSIDFDDLNYKDKFYVRITKDDKERRHPVRFMTPTPITLILK
jgi:hypothetical protein